MQIVCEHCGKRFMPERKWQRFCSTRCHVREWSKTHPRVLLGKCDIVDCANCEKSFEQRRGSNKPK